MFSTKYQCLTLFMQFDLETFKKIETFYRFGPRFPAINKAYDSELRSMAKEAALKLGILGNVHEGIYACVGGPNYETIAELRMLRRNEVDAVGMGMAIFKSITIRCISGSHKYVNLLSGMSTIPEVITAKHCGMVVFAFSLITNACKLEYDIQEEANHEEVVEVGKIKESLLKSFVTDIVYRIHKAKLSA